MLQRYDQQQDSRLSLSSFCSNDQNEDNLDQSINKFDNLRSVLSEPYSLSSSNSFVSSLPSIFLDEDNLNKQDIAEDCMVIFPNPIKTELKLQAERKVEKAVIIQDLSNDFDPNITENTQSFISDEQLTALNLSMKPRNYQKELANLSLHGYNSVICLRTGGGKTLIAALILKYLHVKHKYQLSKPFKSIFIVPTRLLIEQQLDFFKTVFGDDLYNFKLKGLEDEELVSDHIGLVDILFCTPKKLVNCLGKSMTGFNLSMIDLIVFDECHHAIKNHPYNDIMKYYHRLKLSLNSDRKLPQIIGLTASIGSGDGKKPFEHLVYLCANLDCIYLSFVQIFKQELADTVLSDHSYRQHVFQRPKPDLFSQSLVDIMKEIESIAMISPTKPFGSALYMQTLIEINKNSKKIGAREAVIAGDYLLVFNNALMQYEDIPFENVYKNLIECFNSNKLKDSIVIEKFIYKLFEDKIENIFGNETIDVMVQNGKINDFNEKLKRLNEILVEHSKSDETSMGRSSSFVFFLVLLK